MSSILKKFPTIAPYIVCFTAALFFAFELMQLHMMNAIAPLLMQDFNLNATNFGLLSSTYLLADVIFLIPAGIILDKVSTRKVILSAMILCIFGTFGFALAPNFISACLFHFISGIGNAFCFLSCIMLVSKWFKPSKQSLIIALVITMGMFGGFIAQSPFSALANSLSWRFALIVDGFFGLIILSLLALLVHDKESSLIPSSQTPQAFFSDLKKCFFNLQNICCGLYISFMNMPLMIIGAVYGSLFLTQTHGISLTEASFVISMICVGTIIGSPIFGYLGDKINGKKTLMTAGSILSTFIFFIIMYIGASKLITLVALFTLLGIFSSSQVLGYPLITQFSKKELTGTSTSVAAVIIMGLPMFLGPFAGKLIDIYSYVNIETGNRVFPKESFQLSFLIFPIGFILALSLLSFIKEKKQFYQAIN